MSNDQRPSSAKDSIPFAEKDLDGVCCARVIEAGMMGDDPETHHPGALLHTSLESSRKLGAMIHSAVVVLSRAEYERLREDAWKYKELCK